MGFGQYWTSLCLASSSVPSQPCIQFLFVSSRVCVRLPSDSTSPWTPLSFANSSYCQACSGLSPPSCCACWALQNSSLKRDEFEPVVPPLLFITNHFPVYNEDRYSAYSTIRSRSISEVRFIFSSALGSHHP